VKTAVLLNDTSRRYHHGCSRVTRQIKSLLHEQEITVTASSQAHTDWTKNSEFLHKLKTADVIIINGEGTLHHGAARAQPLLDIITSPLSAHRPVCLINALWQENPKHWADIAGQCAIVSVRDSQSAKELNAAGVTDVRLIPDLSLTGGNMVRGPNPHGIIIGDSVRYEIRKLLAAQAQVLRAHYIPTKTLKSRLWHFPPAAAALWRVYNGIYSGKVPDFSMAKDDHEYLKLLSQASGHITGRFHGVCLSILAHTPFLALTSVTSKVQTLIHDAGLDPSRVITAAEFEQNPNRLPPEFSLAEQNNIRDFVDMANQGAQALFSDIRGLL